MNTNLFEEPSDEKLDRLNGILKEASLAFISASAQRRCIDDINIVKCIKLARDFVLILERHKFVLAKPKIKEFKA